MSDDSLAAVERGIDKAWYSLLILAGLFTTAIGLRLVVKDVLLEDVWFHAALVAVGGFLALAGHRGLQYHTNKRLAADLADRLRSFGTRT